MATTNIHILGSEIRDCNDRLDCELKRTLGMSIRTYKIVKAITQLATVGAGVYAMHLGADPGLAFALLALILSGPEVAEYVLMQENPPQTEGAREDSPEQ